MTREVTFTADQAVRTQAALRDALNLEPERFPLAAFIGMISDEVEQLRSAGRSDLEIVELVTRFSGQTVTVAELQANYAPPEARQGPR